VEVTKSLTCWQMAKRRQNHTYLLTASPSPARRRAQGSICCSKFAWSTIKVKGQDTCRSAAYVSQTQEQQRCTISEVPADWHELMIPQQIMRPSIAHANGDYTQFAEPEMVTYSRVVLYWDVQWCTCHNGCSC